MTGQSAGYAFLTDDWDVVQGALTGLEVVLWLPSGLSREGLSLCLCVISYSSACTACTAERKTEMTFNEACGWNRSVML